MWRHVSTQGVIIRPIIEPCLMYIKWKCTFLGSQKCLQQWQNVGTIEVDIYNIVYTECPIRYRTRHFFNNSNTNEDIAKKFEQEYVRCVRNEEECVCIRFKFRCNILVSGKIIKEMPGSVASRTPCIKI